MPYYKYERKSVLEKSNYKLYYDMPKTTDWTAHSNRPDTVILHKTTKEAHSTAVAIPNSHSLHSTTTERLQKYRDLKEQLIRMWQMKTAYILPLVLSTTGTIPDKLHESLKLLIVRPSLYIMIQTAVTLGTCRTVRKFLVEQRMRSALSATGNLWQPSTSLLIQDDDDNYSDDYD